MPAILDGEDEVRRWLDFGEVRSLDAIKLLQSKDVLTFHPVSSFVNNSRNNSPECLQPVDLDSKKVAIPTSDCLSITAIQSDKCISVNETIIKKWIHLSYSIQSETYVLYGWATYSSIYMCLFLQF